MKHRLFTFLAALSLLLCCATAVMWIRSFSCWTSSSTPAARSRRAKHHVSFNSVKGGFSLCIERSSGPDGPRSAVGLPLDSWKLS